MARLIHMIVGVLLAGCTVETKGNEPKPRRGGEPKATVPIEQSSSPGSNLPPALERRRLAAVADLRAGRLDAARAALAALSAEAGPSYAVLNDLAVAEALRGKQRDALNYTNEALRLDPNGLEAAVNKVETLLELGERTRALDFAYATVDRHPKAAVAHVALGNAHFWLSRFDQARNAFETALDLDANNVDAALGVLAIVAQRVDAPEADEVIERTLKTYPENPHALHLAGVARDKRLDDKGALTYYERAVAAAQAQGIDIPFAHYNLGRLLERTSGLEAARPHYEKFLATTPPAGVYEREYVEKQLALPVKSL